MAGTKPALTFLGATGTVTGSRFLVDTGQARVLVDCGMYQGLKELRLRNWAQPPYDPSSIDAVVLTHAHLDHSGMVPVLVRDGFGGSVASTAQTGQLAALVMIDSGHLQEEEADFANRRGYSKHAPALPLYTEADARSAAAVFRTVPFAGSTEIAPGVSLTLQPAGHILGSSGALLEVSGHRLFFSGDVGRPGHPILNPPSPPPEADLFVVESTYGNRVHEPAGDADARLADIVSRTAKRGGTVVIPSFAVDRTEVLLMALRRLTQSKAIPSLPVYADSPMALSVLDVYRRAIAARDPEVHLPAGGPDPFDPGALHELRTPEESKRLNSTDFPSIIVSASGMATGGRVLHHLARCLPDRRHSVVLAGFQAEGTRGRQLADGAKAIRIFGENVPVRAEVCVIDAFSAHADSEELSAWLSQAPRPPARTFVVHGEPAGGDALASRLDRELGWRAIVPSYGETVPIG